VLFFRDLGLVRLYKIFILSRSNKLKQNDMRTTILIISLFVSIASFSQNPDNNPTGEKAKFYLSTMGGVLNGTGESLPAIGVKIGFAKKSFGRLGPKIIASLPEANSLTIAVIDYDYPVQVFDILNIVPNIGVGYTHNTKKVYGYPYNNGTNYQPIGSLGLNAGLSVEIMLFSWLRINAGVNGMIGMYEGSSTYAILGGLVFML
jgi:hypothetical protein